MRIAIRHGVAIVAALLVAMSAACGKSSSDDADDSVKLPQRSNEDSGEDAGIAPPDGSRPDDAAADADTSVPQKTCGEPDLLLCFTFEGVVKDGSPNALVPTAVAGVTFGPGKVGQAAVLADTSFIRYATAPLLTVPVATVEAWVRPTQLLAESVIFDADERYSMAVLPNGALQCSSSLVAGGIVPVGVWTHVACVFDGASYTAYVGGVLKSSGAGATGINAAASAAIGGNAPSGQPFVGAIDSLRVFNVARTAAQIAASAAGN